MSGSIQSPSGAAPRETSPLEGFAEGETEAGRSWDPVEISREDRGFCDSLMDG